MENLIKKLRHCINIIRQSSKLLNELQDICKLTNEKYLQPANDCPTRWSSIYTMIDIAIKQKEVLILLMNRSNIPNIYHVLDNSD